MDTNKYEFEYSRINVYLCSLVFRNKNRTSHMRIKISNSLIFVCMLLTLMLTYVSSDEVTIERSGKSIELSGSILIEAQDDSLLFEANDGQLWIIKPEEVRVKQASETPADPITQEALEAELLKELPSGFRVLKKKHYVIAYQTEIAYAKWIAGLYESRLYPAFEKFWKRKKVDLVDEKHPLVIVIFANQEEYDRYVQRELGEPAGNMVAYYNLMTNRVAMFDLTAGQLGTTQADQRKIEEVLSNPRAIPMVATIIHEATHQLIFNRGMQQRLADTPLWLNEGLALYFEAPDLRSKRGWRTPGKINRPRLELFVQNYANRPADAIERMVTEDAQFQTAETGLVAYAEAWAFNHFLLTRMPNEFAAYLKHMTTHQPQVKVTPQQRLADFKKYFGEDLTSLERDFIKHIEKLR